MTGVGAHRAPVAARRWPSPTPRGATSAVSLVLAAGIVTVGLVGGIPRLVPSDGASSVTVGVPTPALVPVPEPEPLIDITTDPPIPTTTRHRHTTS